MPDERGALDALKRDLGWEPDGRMNGAGVIDGVEVATASHGHRLTKAHAYVPERVVVEARLLARCDLGLVWGKQDIELGEGVSYDDGLIGDPVGYRCAFAEYKAARALFNEAVQASVLALSACGTISLDDDGVRCTMSNSDEGAVVEAVRRCVALAKATEASLRSLPPPGRMGAAGPALLEEARSFELTARARPFTLTGAVASATLEVNYCGYPSRAAPRPGPHASEFGYVFEAFFERPLASPFLLRSAGLIDRVKSSLGFGGLHSGDAEFDRHWVLEAGDRDAAATHVTREARAVLAELRSLGVEVTLHHDRARGTIDSFLVGETARRALQLFAALRPTLADTYSSGLYR